MNTPKHIDAKTQKKIMQKKKLEIIHPISKELA
jgi:hypothetical protein